MKLAKLAGYESGGLGKGHMKNPGLLRSGKK